MSWAILYRAGERTAKVRRMLIAEGAPAFGNLDRPCTDPAPSRGECVMTTAICDVAPRQALTDTAAWPEEVLGRELPAMLDRAGLFPPVAA